MTLFRTVLTHLNRGIEWVLILLSGLLVLIIFCQVVARYGFSAGVGWSEELARYVFIWMIFLGGSVAVYHKANLFIESLVNMLPDVWRRAAQILSACLTLLLLAFVIYYGVTIMPIVQFQTSAGLQVSMMVPYAAIPLGGFLMAVYTFADLLELLFMNRKEVDA